MDKLVAPPKKKVFDYFIFNSQTDKFEKQLVVLKLHEPHDLNISV